MNSNNKIVSNKISLEEISIFLVNFLESIFSTCPLLLNILAGIVEVCAFVFINPLDFIGDESDQ